MLETRESQIENETGTRLGRPGGMAVTFQTMVADQGVDRDELSGEHRLHIPHLILSPTIPLGFREVIGLWPKEWDYERNTVRFL